MRLVLREGDRGVGAQVPSERLAPDAHAHLGLIAFAADVAGNPKRLAVSAHTPIERMELARETADPTGRAVDVQVTRLRRKLERDPRNPRYLQTVRGIGYMLTPD